MPQSFTQLYYHFVWATKGREPVLTRAMLQTVELGVTLYACNGIADHVHLAVRLPAILSPAEFVEQVKGYASWLVNHSPEHEQTVYWQSGYGVVTFRKEDLPTVVRYIQRQPQHHEQGGPWFVQPGSPGGGRRLLIKRSSAGGLLTLGKGRFSNRRQPPG